MVTRTGARADFEVFVAVCSPRLWRTAYLLCGDPAVAERLLRAGLARAWVRWARLDAPPEVVVRGHLVDAVLRRWTRQPARLPARRPAPAPAEPVPGWSRLTTRQRCVVVLRLVDGLGEEDVADLLECPSRVVEAVLAEARSVLGPGDPGPALLASADAVEQPDLRHRLAGVDEEAGTQRRRRRAGSLLATTLAALVVAAGLVVVPGLVRAGSTPVQPLPTPSVPSPQLTRSATPVLLLGHRIPSLVRVRGVPYVYSRSEESAPGAGSLRVVLGAEPRPQVLAWTGSRGREGRVRATVDGRAATGGTGALVAGTVVSPGRPHLVVVKLVRPQPSARLGLAVYRSAVP